MTLVHKSNYLTVWNGIASASLALVSIIKSRTLVYAFALAASATFLISSGEKIPDFLLLLRLSSSVYFLALATYLYNDLTDYDVDKINQLDNKYSSRNTNYRKILYATIIFFTLSISLAFSINLQTGLASLAFFALAIFYSHPKFQLKKLFLIKTLVTATGGFIASLMGATATDNISYIGIGASGIFFLMYFVNGPLGDISDIEGDKKGGRKTIPVVLGVNKTFGIMYAALIAMAGILIMAYCLYGIHFFGLILGLSICGYLIFRLSKLKTRYQDKKKLSATRTIIRFGVFSIQLSILTGMIISTVLT